MSRISFPTPETMSQEQLSIYADVVSGPRGRLVGPLRAAIHNPELATHWQRLGSVLRYRTSLPNHLKELAILVTARRWNAAVEWSIHEREAVVAGLAQTIIDDIAHGRVPDFSDTPNAGIVYEFVRQVLTQSNTDEDIYQKALRIWGEKGVVELSSVIGYYSLVAMTLNVHSIPMPEGTHNTLPPHESEGLYNLPVYQSEMNDV